LSINDCNAAHYVLRSYSMPAVPAILTRNVRHCWLF